MQFPLAAGNGVGVQACDLGAVGDSSRTVLVGEEADKESAGAFVGGSNEAVDAPMLGSQSTMRMLLADRATAHMDDTLGRFLAHLTVPPWAVHQRAMVILPKGH